MDENSLYPLVFDAIKDPVVVVDPGGAVLLANAAAQAMFDFGSSRTLSHMRPVDGALKFEPAEVRELMRQHESVREYQLTSRDGAATGVTMDVETIRAGDGSAMRLLHFRSRSPEVHRDFWKDEMISMVSHELKNPLSAMKNSVDILLSQVPGELTEGQRRFLDTSGRSIQRLTHLVDGFLDVSRIRSGAFVIKRESVDLRDFLGEAMDSFQTLFNVKRVNLDWSVTSPQSDAFVDAAKLEQILINLLSNALKFTPEDGNIDVTIGTAGVESMSDELRLLPWVDLGRPRLLEITVRDTGLGMSTDTLDNVFNRYFGQPGDAEEKGEHLGLNITRALVEAQDGWIDIKSQIGIGTRVTVHLPQDRHTAAVLSRMGTLGRLFRRYQGARRPAVLFMIGKYSDDDWRDICGSWEREPLVNAVDVDATRSDLQLWTLSNELAVAILADRADNLTIERTFGNQFVLNDDHAYVFSSYAVGACHTPAEASTLAQMFNIASTRMSTARDAMAQSTIEKLDTAVECVTLEWGAEN